MGQLVGVVEKTSSIPGLVRYELNRNLTGSGHERFASIADATGPRPSAELARRLFGTGHVASVHLFMNVVTVDLQKGFASDGLADIVRDLYQYWTPDRHVPTIDELVPPAEAAAPGGAPIAAGDGPALSGAAAKIPPALLERSRAALEKWKATH
jgi:hypothetical protein